MRLILAALAAWAAHSLLAPRRRWRVPSVPAGRLWIVVGLLGGSLLAGLPPIIASVVAVIGAVAPGVAARVSAERAAAAARELWPDFLALVRSRIGSGEPLPDAVRFAARSLGDPFSELDNAWGGSFVAEIRRAQNLWCDPVADRVLTTLRVATGTGGAHVDAVLSSLATSLSDELQIRSAHDAALTQQRLTAGVALVAPWSILVLSVATNPQASAAFSTETGHMILAGGAVATSVGFLLARRAAALSAAPRVFE